MYRIVFTGYRFNALMGVWHKATETMFGQDAERVLFATQMMSGDRYRGSVSINVVH